MPSKLNLTATLMYSDALRGNDRACVASLGTQQRSTRKQLARGDIRPRLTPIQTKYDGYHFRSRTEARYAVMFRACYWPYEFERQGFSLERGPYLADFYLPQQGAWVEVKGLPPSLMEEDLCQCLAMETRQPVAIAWGQPSWGTVIVSFTPDGERVLTTLAEFLMRWVSLQTIAKAIQAARSARFEFGETPKIPNLRVVHSQCAT